jgi:predicted alpha/beta-hydrolase family hydrolase
MADQSWQSAPWMPISVTTKDGKTITGSRFHQVKHPKQFVFTHGAGGDIKAAAVENFARGFTSSDAANVILFNGNSNVKARAAGFDAVAKYHIRSRPSSANRFEFVYGGRSMGARAAVMAAHQDKSIEKLILCSYPLTSPKGDMRDQILLDLDEKVNILFISGDNDSMCDLEDLQKVRQKMKAKSWLVVVRNADHGMSLRGGKKMKEGTEQVGLECGKIAGDWISGHGNVKAKEVGVEWDGEEERVVSSGWQNLRK